VRAEQLVAPGLEARSEGVLVARAMELLAAAPRATAELAEQVLGLRGNPQAAALAVFTLLGSDSRFQVDGGGVWSLAGAGASPLLPAALLEEEWVVVDVETTGGSPEHGHRITEIAAVRVSAGRVTERFSTLVNPGRRIPGMITALTGISDQMVRDAPRFGEVAPSLCDFLAGSVFVAHNATFDWRFLSTEVHTALGRRLDGRQLCTVKLARRLLPQLPSRSLDALAIYFGLEIESRHRALDDAVATAHVLLRLIDLLHDRGVTDWAGVQTVLGARTARRRRTASPRSMDQA
jgi:DNA polymerase III subunit epsilon